MAYHYGGDYHRVIADSGETAAAKRWLRPRQTIARYKRSGAILDIGCNTGGFLGTMDGWRRCGIEIDPEAARTARRKIGSEVFVGNALDASFPPESFDVVTCFDVLEHVYQPRELLAKVVTWLKPGGIFYCWLPNIDSWEASLFRSYWFGLELPRHLFHFSPQSLHYLMQSVGMTKISLVTHFCYVEPSIAYLHNRLRDVAGLTPMPLSAGSTSSPLWRAVRKCFRLAVLAPFARTAAWTGAGAGVEGVFRKECQNQDRQ